MPKLPGSNVCSTQGLENPSASVHRKKFLTPSLAPKSLCTGELNPRLLIRQVYGNFPGAPDPLAYAFLGPLVGSVLRIIAGPLSDRFGGARVTQVAGIGMLVCVVGVTFYTNPTSLDDFPWFVGFILGVFCFAGVGNASTFKQIPMLFPPRQAAGVIGWTGAMAAYGPLAAGALIGLSYSYFGGPTAFFWWAAIFYAGCIVLNWWFYARKGAEAPC